jgi:hypothetical protein
MLVRSHPKQLLREAADVGLEGHEVTKLFYLFVLAAGCTKPNPALSCKDGLCSDPTVPFCDVTGSIGGGEPNMCIHVSCTPNEFAECHNDKALTCNATCDDYDLLTCAQGCDAAKVAANASRLATGSTARNTSCRRISRRSATRSRRRRMRRWRFQQTRRSTRAWRRCVRRSRSRQAGLKSASFTAARLRSRERRRCKSRVRVRLRSSRMPHCASTGL